VEGVLHPTFREAAIALGLFENDNEWINCLEEAASFRSPAALRSLFAVILLNSNPTDVSSLFNQFFEHLAEDVRFRNPNWPEEAVLSSVCRDISDILEKNCRNWQDYPGLPVLNTGLYENRLLLEERSYDRQSLLQDVSGFSTFTELQAVAFSKIMESVQQEKGRVLFSNFIGIFFLDGPGGSGKTYLYRILLASVRERGDVALSVASSGIAATLLPGGRTAHSRFKISLDVNACKCNIKR
jgi:chromosomal replication initiation ATPase DnaA